MYPTPQVISNFFQPQYDTIKNVKYEIEQLEQLVESNSWIHTGSISNNLKYIVSGGDDKLLKIWKYNTCALMKTIRFDNCVQISKFTDDSQLLYVGIHSILYQFYSDNQFRILCKLKIHTSVIINIICITSLLILTSSCDTILKTDVNRKQQLLKIQTQTEDIQAFDFNERFNQFACGSSNHTIKECDGNDGSLIIEKLNAHNLTIIQLLFIISNNQLMSLDFNCNLKIWNINYQAQQLEQLQIIQNYGYNISLVLQQQYIVTTFIKTIQVHTIKGELVRQFDHNVETFYFNNTKQPDSMKGVLIQGIYQLQVCKLEMDSIQ
ncbi:hypothetical protein pb186bvf_011889 [Paramecium bursaria]